MVGRLTWCMKELEPSVADSEAVGLLEEDCRLIRKRRLLGARRSRSRTAAELRDVAALKIAGEARGVL
jgi:hypothetical protein